MSAIQFSEQQLRALALAKAWWNSPDRKPYFRIDGYAGTGKSTIANALIEIMGGFVPFATYTGKAASVLARKGVANTSTIHKLIYKPKDKSQSALKALEIERADLVKREPRPDKLIERVDKAIEIEKENLKRPMFALNREDSPLMSARALVIDEYSMVDTYMRDDLLSFEIPILLLGDPGQLPPVKGAMGFTGAADVTLTEIHRQAADSPIIQLATMARQGTPIRPGDYGDNCEVIRLRDTTPAQIAEWIAQADQLLVGRNETRKASNARIRDIQGRQSRLPEAGDKLVCLRNNHEAGFLNGTTWWATEHAVEVDASTVMLKVRNEDGFERDCLSHTAYFYGGTPPHYEIKNAECFDYGGALTVHKSQGSQWDNLVLFDEWFGQNREQWLYTGLTRAAKTIKVVQF